LKVIQSDELTYTTYKKLSYRWQTARRF